LKPRAVDTENLIFLGLKPQAIVPENLRFSLKVRVIIVWFQKLTIINHQRPIQTLPQKALNAKKN